MRRVCGDHRYPGRGRRGYQRNSLSLAYHRMRGAASDPHRRRLVRVGAILTAPVLVVALVAGFIPAGATATNASDNSAARFLSGSVPLAGVNLDQVAALAGTHAASQTGSAAQTSTSPLTLSALGAQLIDLPSGVHLPLSSFLALGAVNQYSQASPAGTARSAAGAVANSGAVDTSPSATFPADASLDLVGLLGLPATGILSTAKLTLGGVTAVAATSAGHSTPATSCSTLSAPVNCRDYTIARGGLVLNSPLLATLVATIDSALGTIGAAVDSAVNSGAVTSVLSAVTSLLSTLDTVLPGLSVVSNTLSVTISTDLQSALSSALGQTLSDGVVSVDLATGDITVDLDALVGGLDHLPPNTHVLSSTVINDLISRVLALLDGLTSQLATLVTNALDAVHVTISGGICLLFVVSCTAGLDIGYDDTLGNLVGGAATLTVTGTGLLSLVGPVLTTVLGTVQSALATATGPLLTTALSSLTTATGPAVSTLTTALDPVLSLINSLVDLEVNVQEPGATAGTFREVAARLSLGSGTIATVDLARAEVAAQTSSAPPATSGGSTNPPTSTLHVNSGLGASATAARYSVWPWGVLGGLLLAVAGGLVAMTMRDTRRVAPVKPVSG